jgi:hypothetical protein
MASNTVDTMFAKHLARLSSARTSGAAGILPHLLLPDLTELPKALSDQGLELGVVQKAVEMHELLPTQLHLLSPQASMSSWRAKAYRLS